MPDVQHIVTMWSHGTWRDACQEKGHHIAVVELPDMTLGAPMLTNTSNGYALLDT
jgi:hypothetical protein